MILVTSAATAFIEHSLQNTDDTSLALRIAAYPDRPNNCYNYRIGFDVATEDDLVIDHTSFKVILHKDQRAFLEDATLDYVAMDDEEMNLIVMNPNDPSYVPPKKQKNNAP